METAKKPRERGMTIMFPEDLWEQIKQRALDDRTTAKQIVVEAMRKVLRTKQ